MNIVVRNEEARDYRRVEEIARDAFWNLYFPGAHEHFVIHKMREQEDFIQPLAFVVEVDGEVAGAMFYTQAQIVSATGEVCKVISFGPVCIAPAYHRQGVGRKMITHSIEKAKELGYRAIMTLGYPYHYEPYGFLGGKNYQISMPDGQYYKGLLVLPLYEDALKGISGHAVFSDVFEVSQEDVDTFDATFEYKEKKVQESQKEFEIASVMLDE